ncbi:hypothetical protein HJG60_008777 [Phyllostomus discolor]|uniref:Uncharacterized protein n=1 Tax=Phyllostomus discolor TaxID=89673 RepID=A0A833YW93_9CHIR|nr:hypothetical protein HJG60_008777 [Phyllostomus discolor]
MACNPSMCPDWESNLRLFGSQPVLNPLSYASQGLVYHLSFYISKTPAFLEQSAQLLLRQAPLSSTLEHKYTLASLKIMSGSSTCYPSELDYTLRGKTVCSISLSLLGVEPRHLYQDFSQLWQFSEVIIVTAYWASIMCHAPR